MVSSDWNGKRGNILSKNSVDDALISYQSTLNILKRITGADSSNTRWRSDLAITHGLIADVYTRIGKPVEALTELCAGQTLLAELLVSAPNSVEWRDVIVRIDTKISRLGTFKNVSATQEGSPTALGE
jgi:hypothetical protein